MDMRKFLQTIILNVVKVMMMPMKIMLLKSIHFAVKKNTNMWQLPVMMVVCVYTEFLIQIDFPIGDLSLESVVS